MPASTLRFDPVRLPFVVVVPVRHRRRRWIALAGVASDVAFRGPERSVYRLVRYVKHEGLFRPLASSQEVQRVVGDQVRRVPLARHPFAVDVEGLVVVETLTRKRHPAVEPGPGRVGGSAHVPLADERGPVAGALEFLREGRRLWVEAGAIVQHAVPVGILPGENRRATRRAERGGHEGVLEQHAAFDQPIEVRCLEERVSERGSRVEALVVDQDEDNVRPLLGRSRGGRHQKKRARRHQARPHVRVPSPLTPFALRHLSSLRKVRPDQPPPVPRARSSSVGSSTSTARAAPAPSVQ